VFKRWKNIATGIATREIDREIDRDIYEERERKKTVSFSLSTIPLTVLYLHIQPAHGICDGCWCSGRCHISTKKREGKKGERKRETKSQI
jgi:hypothetical protein